MPYSLVPCMYYLFKTYTKYLNILKGTEATGISMETISLNFLYLLQMYILKLLLTIHLYRVVLRQHPVPNAGTNPNNTGLCSESSGLALVFLTVTNTCYIVCFLTSVQWDQRAVFSKSESPVPIAPLILLWAPEWGRLLGFHQNQQLPECLRGRSGFKGCTVNISGCISRKGSGLACFQGPEVPLLTLPSIFPENPGWLQILTTPMRRTIAETWWHWSKWAFLAHLLADNEGTGNMVPGTR